MNTMDRESPKSAGRIRILASRPAAQQLTRRNFLGAAALLAAAGGIAACSGSGSSSAASGTSPAATSAALADLGDKLSMYGWASYDDAAVVAAFTQEFGPNVSLDVYNSNEEMIAKLAAAAGTAGYDILMPTGVYLPQIVAAGLLEELDHGRIPNLKYVLPEYLNQPWDPGNKYSVPKDWGSTGFFYDTTIIKRDLTNWTDFVDAMKNEASGKTSIIDAPNELSGLYAWRTKDLDWTSTDTAYLDAVERFSVDEVAPHVRAWDSYPGSSLAQNKYALSMCWNGDARQGFMAASDASRYKWVLGAPQTELWMDNWAIIKGAPRADAAYAWINYILDPVNSYNDMVFHGYNTGVVGVEDKARTANLPFLDMIFFTQAQVATMRAGALNDGTERLVQILAKAKAASAA